jgi:hypothetical protein
VHVAIAVVGAFFVSIYLGYRFGILVGCLAFFPCEAFVIFFVAYIGKYFAKPRLVSGRTKLDSSILGLSK